MVQALCLLQDPCSRGLTTNNLVISVDSNLMLTLHHPYHEENAISEGFL